MTIHGKTTSTRHYQGKFTLMELLVVITIISVLAGLLLPALSRAMDEAKRIACISNQKNIFIGAYAAYASDYNDWIFPACMIHNRDNHFFIYADQLGYIKSSTGPRSNVFCCPSAPQAYMRTVGSLIHHTSYAPNDAVAGPSWFSGSNFVKQRRFKDLQKTAKKLFQVVLLADSMPAGSTAYMIMHPNTNASADPWTDLAPATIHARHTRGASFVFADGHSRWLKAPYHPIGQAAPVNWLVPTTTNDPEYIRW